MFQYNMFAFSVINAENAAHRCEKFIAMATRTRTEYLKDLAQNHVTTTTLDSGSKLSKGFCPIYSFKNCLVNLTMNKNTA